MPSKAEEVSAAAEFIDDAAVLALLDLFDDSPRGFKTEWSSVAGEESDYFAGVALDEQCDEELDGVDALFDLIGA